MMPKLQLLVLSLPFSITTVTLTLPPKGPLTFSLTLNVVGQGVTTSKVSLYHCNYCNKDISGKIRIKCAVCQDFDLCIECFSVGAEVTPHKSNHPYRIMVNLLCIIPFYIYCITFTNLHLHFFQRYS